MSKWFNPEIYWETDGTHNGEKVFCPVYAYGDCPYCDQCGQCHIENPIKFCDDFASFFETWEDWENT